MRNISIVTVSLGLGVLLGYGSFVYAKDSYGMKSAAGGQGWQEWQLDQKQAMSAYTIAHFLTDGQLPPPANKNKFLFRKRDDAGNLLNGDCVFRLKGIIPPARWWNISLDGDQRDATTPAPQLTADDVVTFADGTAEIVISKYPQAGNWLRPANDSNFTLNLMIAGSTEGDEPPPLPALTRTGC